MASGEKKPARARAVLTDISSRAWEHPADRGALVALRKLKGFDVLLKTMSGVFRERAWRLMLLGSAVRVDERQFAVPCDGGAHALPHENRARAPAPPGGGRSFDRDAGKALDAPFSTFRHRVPTPRQSRVAMPFSRHRDSVKAS